MKSSNAVALVLFTAVTSSLAVAQPAGTYARSEASGHYYAPRITVERGYMSDQALSEEVKDELARDPRIDPRKIVVETRHSIVTLSGLVNTPAQVTHAARDASSVPGVSEVRNYVRSLIGGSAGWD
jgi:osmotically-inducible protein OsmY